MVSVSPSYLKYIIPTLLLTLFSCSSQKQVSIGGDWVGTEYMYLCPHYDFGANGKTEEPLTILGPNSLSLAETDAIIAIDSAKAYVKKYGGNEFMEKASFYDISIAYPEKIDELRKLQPLFDVDDCSTAKYYVRFLFSLRTDSQFRFGIALDENFNVVSPPAFPNVYQNPTFINIISPAKAYRIAIKKHREILKEIENIELAFDPQLNSFIWEIDGKQTDIPPLNPEATRIDFTYGLVKVDAVTGNIVEATEYEGYKMICPRYF